MYRVPQRHCCLLLDATVWQIAGQINVLVVQIILNVPKLVVTRGSGCSSHVIGINEELDEVDECDK